MSFFRRDEGGPPPADPRPVRNPAANPGRAAAPGGRAAVTRIAAGTRIEGRIRGTTEVFIEGEVAGAVAVEGLVVVGEGGRVEGEVTARVVEVAGRVDGDVHGSERIEILPSGATEGDLTAPRVVIAEGAYFKGRIEMGTGAGEAPPLRQGAPSAQGQGAPSAQSQGAPSAQSQGAPSAQRPGGGGPPADGGSRPQGGGTPGAERGE